MTAFENKDDGFYASVCVAIVCVVACILLHTLITSDTEAVKMAKLGYEKVEVTTSDSRGDKTTNVWKKIKE